jgi:hypothetical protein
MGWDGEMKSIVLKCEGVWSETYMAQPAPYMMPASWQSGSATSFDISAHNPRKPLRTVADTDTDTPLHANKHIRCRSGQVRSGRNIR